MVDRKISEWFFYKFSIEQPLSSCPYAYPADQKSINKTGRNNQITLERVLVPRGRMDRMEWDGLVGVSNLFFVLVKLKIQNHEFIKRCNL